MNFLPDEEILLIKELIRLTFHSFKHSKNLKKIPKKTIQKVLYKLNKQLPDGHTTKNIIPFYWYLAGPYSEKIDEVISIMKQDQDIINENNGIFELYQFNSAHSYKRFMDNNLFDLQETRQKISNIVDDMTGFNNLQLVRDVYDESPLMFYPTYKSQFLVYFESFCNYFLEQNDLKNHFTEEEILESLTKSKLSLPSDNLFIIFNQHFQRFTELITVVLTYEKKTSSEFLTVLEPSKNISNDIWQTFAYGARILEHDDFYDNRINDWKQKFDSQISILEISLNSTSKFIFETLQISNQIDAEKYNEDKLFREKLAKSLGLEKIPDYDPASFERLTGIIATKIKIKDFDSVEVVREIRDE